MQEDKKIVEELIQATKDLKELNKKLDHKETMLLYGDKLFKDEEELYKYIEKDMIEHPDEFITKENIEQKVLDKISEEAEEIEIYEEEI